MQRASRSRMGPHRPRPAAGSFSLMHRTAMRLNSSSGHPASRSSNPSSLFSSLSSSCYLPPPIGSAKETGMKNGFFRGHGLGNDYIVMDPKELSFKLTSVNIKAVCNRNWGLGSDGILALVPSKKADFGLRIYNPDSSGAEQSGNGLRIIVR